MKIIFYTSHDPLQCFLNVQMTSYSHHHYIDQLLSKEIFYIRQMLPYNSNYLLNQPATVESPYITPDISLINIYYIDLGSVV